MFQSEDIKKCKDAAQSMRKNILELAHQAGNLGSHVGPSLSIVEILAVLYSHTMKIDLNNPDWEERDRFILSKGHGGLGYYTALSEAGIITKSELFSYEKDGSYFPGQPSKRTSHGIEYSSGSLGMGLSYACGIALAAKLKKKKYRTFVLVGDGEVNEGSIWESVMFAKHFNLSSLTVIIDRNNMQSDGKSEDIMSLNLEEAWKGFGWQVDVCDGHSIEQLMDVLSIVHLNLPRVIVANTVKGKGISFMENSKDWHHNRLTNDLYSKAIQELGFLE